MHLHVDNDADTLNVLLIWLGRSQAREWLQIVSEGWSKWSLVTNGRTCSGNPRIARFRLKPRALEGRFAVLEFLVRKQRSACLCLSARKRFGAQLGDALNDQLVGCSLGSHSDFRQARNNAFILSERITSWDNLFFLQLSEIGAIISNSIRTYEEFLIKDLLIWS